MTNDRKRRIEEYVVDLLKYYGLYKVDGKGPVFTVKDLQQKFTFEIKEKELEESLQGAIFVGKNNKVKIVVNSIINNVGRKNFTIAHELGHYFLKHKLDNGQSFCSVKDIESGLSASSQQEVEANYFSSCFLMPKEYLYWNYYICMKDYLHLDLSRKLYVGPNTIFNWRNMCSWFDKQCGVSQTALKIRLEQFNLLTWDLNY